MDHPVHLAELRVPNRGDVKAGTIKRPTSGLLRTPPGSPVAARPGVPRDKLVSLQARRGHRFRSSNSLTVAFRALRNSGRGPSANMCRVLERERYNPPLTCLLPGT